MEEKMKEAIDIRFTQKLERSIGEPIISIVSRASKPLHRLYHVFYGAVRNVPPMRERPSTLAPGALIVSSLATPESVEPLEAEPRR